MNLSRLPSYGSYFVVIENLNPRQYSIVTYGKVLETWHLSKNAFLTFSEVLKTGFRGQTEIIGTLQTPRVGNELAL